MRKILRTILTAAFLTASVDDLFAGPALPLVSAVTDQQNENQSIVVRGQV